MIEAGASAAAPGSWWLRRAGFSLGVLLLGAALFAVWRQRETILEALEAARNISPGRAAALIAILFGAVIGNFVLTGILFTLLMRRYGRVGVAEMQALIAASTLLNYVPLRPGLIGRVAYHRRYNNIPIADSARVIVQSVMLSVISAGWLVIAIAASKSVLGKSIPLWALASAPLPAMLIAAIALRGSGNAVRMALAAAVRYLDLMLLAVRYWAAFALIGSPIDSAGALAFACVGMMATMVPFLSNGLGLREWAVGFVAPLVSSYQMTLGIAADLVNRAAEITLTVPAGLIALAVLNRIRMTRAAL